MRCPLALGALFLVFAASAASAAKGRDPENQSAQPSSQSDQVTAPGDLGLEGGLDQVLTPKMDPGKAVQGPKTTLPGKLSSGSGLERTSGPVKGNDQVADADAKPVAVAAGNAPKRQTTDHSGPAAVSGVPVEPSEEAATGPQQAPARAGDDPPPPQVAAAIDAAYRSFDQNDPKQARTAIEEALKQYPNDPDLQAVAKLIEPKDIKSDTPKLAQKIKGLLFNPPPQDQALAQAGRPQAALASPIGGLLAAAAARPGVLQESVPLQLRQSLPEKTMLDMKMGDYSSAEADLSRRLGSDPNDFVAYRLRGLTRYYEQNLPGAESDADQALRLNPKDSPSHWIKSLVKLDSGDAEAAKNEADASLALDPKNADALVTRAEALEKLGQPDAALADYRQAADLDPEFKQLYHRALLRRGMSADLTRLSRARALYLAAAGLALLFLGLSFFVKRRQTTVAKAPMRGEDHHPALGGFRILRRVGQGGMGVVYEAVDEALERRVALKRMRDEVAGDPRERKRFLKEARTVAALRHPGIVEIFSIVEQDQALYLVFEFLQGQTLDAVLSESPKLPPARALPLAREIASALDYAHSRGVVHQDLKPGNVVVEGGHAKVMDFGIARRVQETLSTISRMEVAGTPAYMAPEQERGTVSPAADVYAFGACLYEMLGGQRPFSVGGYMEKAQRQYPPLSGLAGLPASVDRVIDRALDPDPLRRPASAQDLVAALEGALALPRA